jgi:FG-GAP-like repeat/FG-GAP repeat
VGSARPHDNNAIRHLRRKRRDDSCSWKCGHSDGNRYFAGSTPVTPGQVNFCDATAKFCTDIHLLGTAQLTANGTATLKFRPGVGSHSYKAVLAEPAGLGPSASTASSLTVTASQGTGQLATTTYLEASGVPNAFSLTATVLGNGNTLPTGMVSFVDASNENAVLGTAALTSEPGAGFAGSSLLPVASLNSGNAVLTADFNDDGIPDLVILGNDTISVLLGNGDGTFTAAPYPSSELPGAIAVGDFNGDGIHDLAVAPVLDEGNSEVLLGKGDGTFTIAKGSFGIANGTSTSNSIAVGDFNGDGNLDLVETCASVDDQPCNLLLTQFGNGDGTFMQSSGIPIALTFSGSQSMAVGDFNGDGKPDLAVTNSGANGVNVFLNDGGAFCGGSKPGNGRQPHIDCRSRLQRRWQAGFSRGQLRQQQCDDSAGQRRWNFYGCSEPGNGYGSQFHRGCGFQWRRRS